MASRFFKIGSIYSRVNGFIRKGFLNYEERPLWYDVYTQFPPKYEPKFSRPAPDIEIQDIFYPEDVIRAKIHKQFGQKLGIYNLDDETKKTNSQIWIESYNEFITQGMSQNEALKRLEDLIQDSAFEYSRYTETESQDSVSKYSRHTETESHSPVTSLAETISRLKVSNTKYDEDENIEGLSLKTKSGMVNENLSEDINVDETIEVSGPVIPMAKTVSKLDEKNKDSSDSK